MASVDAGGNHSCVLCFSFFLLLDLTEFTATESLLLSPILFFPFCPFFSSSLLFYHWSPLPVS